MPSRSAPRPDESDGPDEPVDDIWVPARQAALVLAKPERWLREECRAGHLPCQGEPRTGQVFLVPMTATEELAEQPPPATDD
jgi:hypothetical protein